MDVLSIKTAQKCGPNKVQFCSAPSENQFSATRIQEKSVLHCNKGVLQQRKKFIVQ